MDMNITNLEKQGKVIILAQKKGIIWITKQPSLPSLQNTQNKQKHIILKPKIEEKKWNP